MIYWILNVVILMSFVITCCVLYCKYIKEKENKFDEDIDRQLVYRVAYSDVRIRNAVIEAYRAAEREDRAY